MTGAAPGSSGPGSSGCWPRPARRSRRRSARPRRRPPPRPRRLPPIIPTPPHGGPGRPRPPNNTSAMTRRDLSSQPAAPGTAGRPLLSTTSPFLSLPTPAASPTFVPTNRRKDPMTTPTNTTRWQRPTPTIPPGRFTPPGGPAATAPPTNARTATSRLLEPARRRGSGDPVTRTYPTPHGPEHLSPLTPQEDQMQTLHRPRWSHGCGNPPVPWSWQATLAARRYACGS
jgi:hypothetical protein